MKVVFMGTPDFAVPALDKIYNSKHEILACITQPDKPSDRGHKITASPVKLYAKEKNLTVLQYNKIREQGVEDLKMLAPDIVVTAAFGQILSQEILDIPKHGVINIHASLLPKYRGSAPISWAILNGEEKTGITIMQTEKGVDTGDIILQEETAIGEDETTGELFDRLANIGADLVIKALDLIESGNATFTKQDESQATKCRMLNKEDGKLDFTKTAKEVYNTVRGCAPWPCAYFEYQGNKIKVFKAKVVEEDCSGEIGEVVLSDKKVGLYVKCKDKCISLEELQFPASKRVNVKDFLNGREIVKGSKLC